MMTESGRVCLPGDSLGAVVPSGARLGPGLRADKDGGGVTAYRAGVLKHRNEKVYWIDCNSRRYIPARGERVVGIVVQTGAKQYRVDIGAHCPASLPELSFEGATKRNKPNLQVGDLVYASVSEASADVEPELQCVDGGGRGKGLGPLKDSPNAFMLTCSLSLCRKLFETTCPVLEALKKRGFKFEVVPGMNGRVWLDSTHLYHTIAIANAITLSEFMTDEETEGMAEKLGSMVMA